MNPDQAVTVDVVRQLAEAADLVLADDRLPLVAETLADVFDQTRAWQNLPLEDLDPEILYVGSWENW